MLSFMMSNDVQNTLAVGNQALLATTGKRMLDSTDMGHQTATHEGVLSQGQFSQPQRPVDEPEPTKEVSAMRYQPSDLVSPGFGGRVLGARRETITRNWQSQIDRDARSTAKNRGDRDDRSRLLAASVMRNLQANDYPSLAKSSHPTRTPCQTIRTVVGTDRVTGRNVFGRG